MNITTTYSKRLEGHNAVKAAYDREAASFEQWAKPRALAHIVNARIILEKYNGKERQRDGEVITFPSDPWMTDRQYDLKIDAYTATAITFSYYTPSARAQQATDRQTFSFPIEWLSLSTWDFNKLIRGEIQKELKRRDLNRKRAAEEQARKLRKQIWDAQASIKKQTDALKKLEEVYSA